jgi:hypothetical protein
MKAPPRERWLRIFRRQIELGKIEIDPEKRPRLIAFLTSAMEGRLWINPQDFEFANSVTRKEQFCIRT